MATGKIRRPIQTSTTISLKKDIVVLFLLLNRTSTGGMCEAVVGRLV
jgi:hypothetical protein